MMAPYVWALIIVLDGSPAFDTGLRFASYEECSEVREMASWPEKLSPADRALIETRAHCLPVVRPE